MLAMTQDGTPVVWVDTYRPATMDQTKLFNAVLRERAAQRPNTSVASWFDVASADPKALISKDQVHPNEAGQAAFADTRRRAPSPPCAELECRAQALQRLWPKR